LIAKELRTFEKYGVQVDVVYIPSGPLAVSALIAGNLTLAIAASNAVISAISKGAPLIAVAAQRDSLACRRDRWRALMSQAKPPRRRSFAHRDFIYRSNDE
jgi:hypothetical protein